MQIVIGRCRVVEDVEWNGVDGTAQPKVEKGVPERREEEWGGLTGDAGQGQHNTGDDAGSRRRQNDAPGCLPARAAQRQGGIAQRYRNQAQDLLGGAHHGRDHQDAERDAAGKS